MNKKDINYLKIAIEKSRESSKSGLFPAGAVIVQEDVVNAESTIGKYPKTYEHAEYKVIDKAVKNINDQLGNCILYCSMETCLMCLSKVYWTGIRRFVFAISRQNTNKDYYEGEHVNSKILKRFHDNIQMLHIEELEEDTLDIVREWEERGGFDQ